MPSGGRGDRIRTCDFRLPKATLYQAELRPDTSPPAKLISRLAAMTVCAANFTFCDLQLDPSPAYTSTAKYCNIVDFLPCYVIEFQHAKIGLTAVDAVLVGQVLAETLRISATIGFAITVSSSIMQSFVAKVMRP
jgi:hypothetical protein